MGERTRGGQNKIDYIISLDTVKELSMVEKNDKGKEFSRLFDTKKQHTDGSPIMQVKWAESVLSI